MKLVLQIANARFESKIGKAIVALTVYKELTATWLVLVLYSYLYPPLPPPTHTNFNIFRSLTRSTKYHHILTIKTVLKCIFLQYINVCKDEYANKSAMSFVF